MHVFLLGKSFVLGRSVKFGRSLEAWEQDYHIVWKHRLSRSGNAVLLPLILFIVHIISFQISSYVVRCLIRSWNLKYSNIHCAANLLAGLTPYHVSTTRGFFYSSFFPRACMHGKVYILHFLYSFSGRCGDRSS